MNDSRARTPEALDAQVNASLTALNLAKATFVSQPIPPVPIPLLPGETQPVLDLQGVLEQVYQRGR